VMAALDTVVLNMRPFSYGCWQTVQHH
jgi:hypothetical protein